MINPEELMIGNWVQGKQGNEFQVKGVTNVWHYGIEYNTINLDWHSDELEMEDDCENVNPIPITEGWLERFGFTYDSVSWEKGSWLIGDFKDGFYFLLDGKLNGRRMLIKYVHELQNLYFWTMRSKLKEKVTVNNL